MNKKIYDILKWITLYFLPAFGTLWFTISQLWGLSYAEEILGTCTALTIFLSVLLKISKTSYIKSGAGLDGQMIIDTTDENKDVYRLEVNNDFDTLSTKDTIVFKVVKNKDL